MKNIDYKKIVLIAILFGTLLLGCSNEDKISGAKENTRNETKSIEELKGVYKKDADSLRKEIAELSKKKIELSRESKLAEAEIYDILKKSHFDHLILVTKNLEGLSNYFNSKLGFKIKQGTQHKNGINNNFIEFENNSEIEIITVSNPSDKLAEEYLKITGNKTKAIRFALRVDKIEVLKDNFSKLKNNLTKLDINPEYKLLSSDEIVKELPVFFIQYNQEANNTVIDHPNTSKGISSIWFSTIDGKKTAKKLTDFGFNVVKKINIEGLTGRKILFRNNNLEIILIESNINEIIGISIIVKDIKLLKSKLSENFKNEFRITNNIGRQSIFLSPDLTKSIWIEFFEL